MLSQRLTQGSLAVDMKLSLFNETGWEFSV